MESQLARVDPFRAARVVAIVFLLVGLVALPFLYHDLVVTPEHLGFSKLVVFIIPFLLSGIGFATTALGCVLYNWLIDRRERAGREGHP